MPEPSASPAARIDDQPKGIYPGPVGEQIEQPDTGSTTVAAPLPLFRPEASGASEHGEAFAFAVPGWRAPGVILLLAALLFLPFAVLADFDRVAQVRGVVVPASGVSRLVAQHPGIVTAAYVRQGQAVAKGDALLKISAANFLPGGGAASSEILDTYRGQQAIAAEARIAQRQRQQMERAQLDEENAQLASTLGSLGAQIALQQQRIAKNQQRLQNLAPLLAKGYVSQLTYQTQEETILALQQQLAVLGANREQTRHELERGRLRLGEFAVGSHQAELDASSSALALARGAADAGSAAELIVRAPAAGVVTLLRAAPGAVVGAGEEVAAMVRTGDRLEALLSVPPDAAGFLARGQKVALRYDAFPYQRYGLGHGIVRDIAMSASRAAPGAPPAYLVRVLITRAPGRAYAALRPDMTLSASIVIERRSLLDWLLSPLRGRWRDRAGAA